MPYYTATKTIGSSGDVSEESKERATRLIPDFGVSTATMLPHRYLS